MAAGIFEHAGRMGSRHDRFLYCVLIAAVCGFSSCSKRTPAEIEFLRFIDQHVVLSNPASHEFRSILVQRPSPKFYSTCWGWVDGPYSCFRVDQGMHDSVLFEAGKAANLSAFVDRLSGFRSHSEFDWINGKNRTYSFGVKPNESGYTLLGYQWADPDRMTSTSTFPFALIYDHCLIRDAQQHYELVSFGESNHPEFPDCRLCELKSKNHDFLNSVFLHTLDGKCMGMIYRDARTGEVTGKHVFAYKEVQGQAVPLAEKVFFPNQEGDLVLTRLELFLDWKKHKAVRKDVCYLSHYGLPEPPVPQGSRARLAWFWVAMLIAMAAVGGAIYVRKSRST